jgi:hypothetical protein
MIEALVLVIALLVAALVMASGVWVAIVLTATVARARRSTPSARSRAVGEADSR